MAVINNIFYRYIIIRILNCLGLNTGQQKLEIDEVENRINISRSHENTNINLITAINKDKEDEFKFSSQDEQKKSHRFYPTDKGIVFIKIVNFLNHIFI